MVPEGQGNRRGNDERDGSQDEREGIHCQPGDKESRGLWPGACPSGDSVGAKADAISGGAAAGGKAGGLLTIRRLVMCRRVDSYRAPCLV